MNCVWITGQPPELIYSTKQYMGYISHRFSPGSQGELVVQEGQEKHLFSYVLQVQGQPRQNNELNFVFNTFSLSLCIFIFFYYVTFLFIQTSVPLTLLFWELGAGRVIEQHRNMLQHVPNSKIFPYYLSLSLLYIVSMSS